MLQNIVKTLPENIGDLKALKFISLPQNAKLVSIPESVNNLPDLTFLNLMNSNPNVIIPNSVRERLDDEGHGFYYLN
jgi:Leucine-rich repeat (LRR) protein